MGIPIVTRRNSGYESTHYNSKYPTAKPSMKPANHKPPVAHIEPDLSKIYLPKLGLSSRALNALHEVNIYTVDDLAKLTREEIKDIPRIGTNTLSEIETALIKNNLFAKTKLCIGKEPMNQSYVTPNIEIYDKTEIKDYNKPRIPKEFKVYTWMYYDRESWDELEAYKPLIAEKFRNRYKDFIQDDDIVTIVWSDYFIASISKEDRIDVPKGADARLYTMGDAEKNTMSFCMGFCMVLSEKMIIPTQVFCEAVNWLGSLRMPEFRSPMILHKGRLTQCNKTAG